MLVIAMDFFRAESLQTAHRIFLSNVRNLLPQYTPEHKWLDVALRSQMEVCRDGGAMACVRRPRQLRTVCGVRNWPQKSCIFRVSTAPTPSTLFRVERTGVTRWRRSLSTYTFSKLDASKKKRFWACLLSKRSPAPLDQRFKMKISPVFLIVFCSPQFQIQAVQSRCLCAQDIGRYRPDKCSTRHG
jgi:hypothetical protein